MAFNLAALLTGGAAGRPDSVSGLKPQFQTALGNMLASAPPNVLAGVKINSAFRSPAVQAQLFDRAVKKYGSVAAARKWVAPPGRSRHGHGDAADIKMSPAARQWIHANAGNYGLAFPMSWEPWHIELAGARGGKQSPPPTVAGGGIYEGVSNQPAPPGPSPDLISTAPLSSSPAFEPAPPPDTRGLGDGNQFRVASRGDAELGVPTQYSKDEAPADDGDWAKQFKKILRG